MSWGMKSPSGLSVRLQGLEDGGASGLLSPGMLSWLSPPFMLQPCRMKSARERETAIGFVGLGMVLNSSEDRVPVDEL